MIRNLCLLSTLVLCLGVTGCHTCQCNATKTRAAKSAKPGPLMLRVQCPECSIFVTAAATKIMTNGSRSVPGGFMAECTTTVTCTNCQTKFDTSFERFARGRPKATVLDPALRAPGDAPPMPPMPPQSRAITRSIGSVVLSITLTNVVDTAMVSWVAGPPTMDGAVVAGGGSGTIGINCYTGPAITLTATGLNDTNGCFIENSPNLVNWMPFPTNGFQLTLVSTNPSSTLVLDQPTMFYRGRVGPVYY